MLVGSLLQASFLTIVGLQFAKAGKDISLKHLALRVELLNPHYDPYNLHHGFVTYTPEVHMGQSKRDNRHLKLRAKEIGGGVPPDGNYFIEENGKLRYQKTEKDAARWLHLWERSTELPRPPVAVGPLMLLAETIPPENRGPTIVEWAESGDKQYLEVKGARLPESAGDQAYGWMFCRSTLTLTETEEEGKNGRRIRLADLWWGTPGIPQSIPVPSMGPQAHNAAATCYGLRLERYPTLTKN